MNYWLFAGFIALAAIWIYCGYRTFATFPMSEFEDIRRIDRAFRVFLAVLGPIGLFTLGWGSKP